MNQHMKNLGMSTTRLSFITSIVLNSQDDLQAILTEEF